jgi:aspartyl protease family protein
MLRNYLIFIFALGIFGAMLNRVGSEKPDHSNDVSMIASEAAQEHESSEPRPGQISGPDGAIELARNLDGHFYADVQINGATVHMLVDTGATGVALSREDARNAGIATSIGMNDVVGRGADGDVRGEFVSLDRVELGSKRAEGVEAIVLNSGEQSLLGQTVLSQFGSVEIQGDKMVLR